MNYQCTFCQIKSFENLINKLPITEEEKDEVVNRFLQVMASVDRNKDAPEIAGEIHATIRSALNNPDPYKEQKRENNEDMLQQYETFREIIHTSSDRFKAAMRMALGGNIIDFGPNHKFNINETLSEAMTATLAIDDTEQLKKDVKQARQILYLGDNAGEIVLDKLFIETLDHPNVWFAVRGNPVINDATEEEARFVGMHRIARIINNGDDSPSTVLSRVSEEFLEVYKKSDLVIAKGMGNLEGLLQETRPDLYFLLMIKCDRVGNLIGVEKGRFVVRKNRK